MSKFTLEPLFFRANEQSTATTTHYAGTRSEAMAAINAQPVGTRFLVYVTAPAVDTQGDDMENSTLAVSVQITKSAMLRAVDACMRDSKEEGGARIPFSTYQSGHYRAFYLF